MNHLLPLADPVGLPAPFALLRGLLLASFLLHVIPMNLVLGGGLVAGWAALRGRAALRDGDTDTAERMRVVAGGLAGLLPVSTALAVTFGVAPLLFVQLVYGPLYYTSSILMAWGWLAVIPLILLGYAGYHALAARGGSLDRAAVGLSFGGGIAFLLVALLFCMEMTLLLHPERFHALYAANQQGLHLNLDEPMLWPRYLHFVVASFAVTGLTVAILGAVRRRRDPALGAAVRTFGVRLFLASTLVQFAVGVWFLLSMPPVVRDVFLGGRAGHTSLLITSVLMSVVALLVTPRSLAGGTTLTALTLCGMVVIRQRVRALMVEPAFMATDLEVHPQWGAFTLFALCLVGGIVVVTWMVVRLAGSRPREIGG
jgi:hypothetical protein